MLKKLALLAVFACATLLVLPLAAQDEAAESEHAEASEPSLLLKVINFGILAGGLFFIGRKAVPAMFRARTEEIQKDIAAAQQTKREADERAAQMEARLNRLAADIEAFRTEAAADMREEGERIRHETVVQIQRLENQAALEIDSASKTARRELREFATELALKLAEERVRARLDSATQAALVDGFVAELGRQGSQN
jgi:F-type H+-transporting ATPase subunit b